MTRIFYDTEFVEDGRTVDLISIGMVAEDGRELYLVNQAIVDDEIFHERICRDRWLMENVVPSLPLRKDRNGKPAYGLSAADNVGGHFSLDMDSNQVVSLRFIRNAVRDFILATPDPQLWAWYAAYDHVAYAQLFGRMIDLPDGLPMFTCDLKQEAERLGNPPVPEQETGVHNALADARHNLEIARFLDGLAVAA